MRLGIIGLPASGKTTLFNLLTGENLPTGPLAGGGRFDTHTAVIDIPDARLDALVEILKPRKTTYAKVTAVDIGGLEAGVGREGLPGQMISHLDQVDGLLVVVRAFDDPSAPHPAGAIDPGRDLQAIEAEFLLHDMLTVDRRLQRLREERQKGARDRAIIDHEIALLEGVEETLASQEALRKLDYSAEDARFLSGFGLLTRKPALVVINHGEASYTLDQSSITDELQVLIVRGKLEMEIAQLPHVDARDFMIEYEIEQPGRDRVIHACCEALGFLSFFTFNEQEGRAWLLRRGGTALEAAETIHSDLARGFIKAEVIAWDVLTECGGLTEARSSGKLRLEGKDYQVADGELIYIRFSV
jgi:GTP-binding protein YchF